MKRLAVLALFAGSGCAHQVVLHSNPEGAVLTLDGKDMGPTPVTIDDVGSLGGNKHVAVLTLPDHQPIKTDLDQSLRPGSLALSGVVGVGTALVMLVTGAALVGTAGGATGVLPFIGLGLCLTSPLGVAAGCPIGAHAWQLSADQFVLGDFVAQDRAATMMAARELAAKQAAEKAAAEEAQWTMLCSTNTDSSPRPYFVALKCAERVRATDINRAIYHWGEAARAAPGPAQVCKPAKLIKANTTHPEEALKDVSQMILEQCRDKDQCLIHCQSVYDTCLNTPVQQHLLSEHTTGCENANNNCTNACMR